MSQPLKTRNLTVPSKVGFCCLGAVAILAIVAVFLGLPAGIVIASMFKAIHQDWVMDHYLPTPVRIISVGISKHQGGRSGPSYTLEFRYELSVRGRTYFDNGALPLNYDYSKSQASQMIAPFHAGQVCTAWYNPNDPSNAFLIRRYQADPVGALTFGTILMAAVACLWWFGSPRPLGGAFSRELDGGQIQLLPKYTLRQFYIFLFVLGTAWIAIPLPFVIDFGMRTHWQMDRFASALEFVFFAMGFGIIVVACNKYWLSRRIGAAEIFIVNGTPKLGAPLALRINEEFLQPVEHKVEVILICKKRTRSGRSSQTKVCYKKVLTAPQLSGCRATKLTDQIEFLLPPPASSGDPKGEEAQYTWSVRLRTELTNFTRFSEEFRLPLPKTAAPEMERALS